MFFEPENKLGFLRIFIYWKFWRFFKTSIITTITTTITFTTLTIFIYVFRTNR